MNMKKSAIALIVCIFVALSFGILYIFSELYIEGDVKPNKINDSIKFKNEYESINGKESKSGNVVRSLTIEEDNPFIYSDAGEIAKKIENKESFYVYFGFTECPWCRSVLPSLIESAKKNKIDKIYYVNILEIRDIYELDENNKLKQSRVGTENYYKLLKLLDKVLDNYSPLTYKTKNGKTKKVEIKEKRIYAPNIIAVKDGKPLINETGISKLLVDPYMNITNEMKQESIEKFNCVFESLTDDKCVCDNKQC